MNLQRETFEKRFMKLTGLKDSKQQKIIFWEMIFLFRKSLIDEKLKRKPSKIAKRFFRAETF